jgi:transposase
MRKILPDSKHGTEADLRRMTGEEKDVKHRDRLLGIRMLMLGYSFKETGTICDVSRTCLQKWVKRWNNAGKEGLKSRSGGSKSKVTASMRADIREVVEIRKVIDGRVVTGKLICGYLKKTLQ